MAPQSNNTSEENLKYVMHLLKTCDAFKPDYHSLASEFGISNANNAQKRFKKIVEQAGFRLVAGAVVDSGENGGPATNSAAATSTPVTPKKRSRTKKDTPSKKHKAPTVLDEAENDELEIKSGVEEI